MGTLGVTTGKKGLDVWKKDMKPAGGRGQIARGDFNVARKRSRPVERIQR